MGKASDVCRPSDVMYTNVVTKVKLDRGRYRRTVTETIAHVYKKRLGRQADNCITAEKNCSRAAINYITLPNSGATGEEFDIANRVVKTA